MATEGAKIRIRGAATHNLKNVDLDIPRDRLVVITGLSGSGKSSLAFDTLYAEGQRKYVESLSAYARQFLEQLQKPEVDELEGLPPTIAIAQHARGSNPRSTVATTTEIYDYLRLLYARAGEPHCPVCKRAIRRHSTAQMVDAVLALPPQTPFMVLAPLARGERGEHTELIRRARRAGFVRLRVDGELREIHELEKLSKTRKHTIEAVVERRLTVKPETKTRLADSIAFALATSDGTVIISELDGDSRSAEHLFSSRYTCPQHPGVSLPELEPKLFSFNSPLGACPTCHGLGTVLEFDPDLVVYDDSLSLAQGAIDPWRHGGKRLNAFYHRLMKDFCAAFGVSPEMPLRNIPQELRRILMRGTDRKDERKYGQRFEGVLPNLQRRWKTTESEAVKQRLHSYLNESPCRQCGGARLVKEALAVCIGGKNIHELSRMSISAAYDFLTALKLTGERKVIAEPVLREVCHRLSFMNNVGIGYLTLDRNSATLSGGESQRIRLATQIGSGLVGVCYVLDEPTIGLHQRDSEKLITTLRHLTDLGNTVLVVEHDEDTIRAADHVIDMGPGAGAHGGEVVAQGTLADITAEKRSVTGRYLSGRARITLPAERRKPDPGNFVEVRGARHNNLKGIDVRFPLGCFICVTGVSGSGKSSLVDQTLLPAMKRRLYSSREKPGDHDRIVGGSRVDKIVQIDQTPIGRTPRSNPATYTSVFDLIRRVYAKTREAKLRGYNAGRFSFNVKGGRCEECQGQGTKRIEMHFLPDVYVTCDACQGTRYNRETLEIRYRGKTIADVLNMRVEEAIEFFDSFSKIKKLLRALSDVGLSYTALGQSSTTLSGGEAQRIKLAAELGRPASGHTMYVLDEPTTGLHIADIHNLLNVLNRLVDYNNTVLVIEHNLDVIKMADWVIDLGPEGGDAGGRIVAEGTPEQLAAEADTHTGRFLRARMSA
jgi:excinuclease ABC subunit A